MMQVGRHTSIAGTGLEVSARVTIGSFTSIAPNVSFVSREDHACIAHPGLVATYQFTGYPAGTSRDEIVVGSDVWIGRNAVILGGVTIGHGAIIGAFSVVAKDVPPYAVVVGNPARIKRFRFETDQIEKLLRIAWWTWDDEVLRFTQTELTDIDGFLTQYTIPEGLP